MAEAAAAASAAAATQEAYVRPAEWYSEFHWLCECGYEYNSVDEACWCHPTPAMGCHRCKTPAELLDLEKRFSAGGTRSDEGKFYRDERWKIAAPGHSEWRAVLEERQRERQRFLEYQQRERVPQPIFPKEQDKTVQKEVHELFKRLRAQPANQACFDCGAKSPTWALISYGTFICMDCAALHRTDLGADRSQVRSTTLDFKWTRHQRRVMELGGNERAERFLFKERGLDRALSMERRYNSADAAAYRELLARDVARLEEAEATAPAGEGSK